MDVLFARTFEDNKLLSMHIPEYVMIDRATKKVNVTVRANIISIHNIDTINHSYNINLWLQMKWKVCKSELEIDIVNDWTPELTLINCIGAPEIENNVTCYQTHIANQSIMCREYKIQCTLSEHFELQLFPLDIQRLHVSFAIWNCPMKVNSIDLQKVVKICKGRACSLFLENFGQIDAWTVNPNIHMRSGLTDMKRDDANIQYCTLELYVKVERCIAFYVHNMLIPIFSLVSLSFMSFVCKIDDIQTSTGITLSCLLTLVTLKFVIQQDLPASSRLTLLEKYVLGSYIYIALVAVQNALVYANPVNLDIEMLIRYNNWTGNIMIIVWMLSHVIIWIGLHYRQYWRYDPDDFVDPSTFTSRIRKMNSGSVINAYMEHADSDELRGVVTVRDLSITTEAAVGMFTQMLVPAGTSRCRHNDTSSYRHTSTSPLSVSQKKNSRFIKSVSEITSTSRGLLDPIYAGTHPHKSEERSSDDTLADSKYSKHSKDTEFVTPHASSPTNDIECGGLSFRTDTSEKYIQNIPNIYETEVLRQTQIIHESDEVFLPIHTHPIVEQRVLLNLSLPGRL